MAVKRSDYKLVQRLLESGTSIDASDEDGSCPIHFAVRRNDLRMVKMLLKSGASPNVRNDSDMAPLHYAVYEGYPKIISTLLREPRVNVDVPDGEFMTPLMIAARMGDVEHVRLLLGRGANVNVVDEKGWTPLMHAVWNLHHTIAAMLLNANSLVQVRSVAGDNALILAVLTPPGRRFYRGVEVSHSATAAARLLIIRKLLARNSPLDVVGKQEKTALELAREMNNREVIDLLEQAEDE